MLLSNPFPTRSMKRFLQTLLLSLCLVTGVQAQPAVIIENFRNVNCGNCREPDIQFEQWLEANKSSFHADVIYYHNEITDPQDPFYLASRTDVDFRSKTFYVIPANPRVYVQGFDAQETISTWQQAVQAAAAQQSKAAVTITELESLGSNRYSFKASVVNSSGEQIKLLAALTESGINYENAKAYGNPPSGKWDNIFRKMLPDRDGSDPIGASGEQTFTFDLTGKNWDITKMKAVVFAQSVNAVNANSRIIWGHSVASFASLDVAEDAPAGFSLKAVANPFTNHAPIEIRMGAYGHLRVEMIDMTGKKIATLADHSLSEGLHNFAASGIELVTGTYLINAFVDGNFAGQVKIVKQ